MRLCLATLPLHAVVKLFVLLFTNRTLIAHTKALDPTRPVTFVTDTNYAVDRGVS